MNPCRHLCEQMLEPWNSIHRDSDFYNRVQRLSPMEKQKKTKVFIFIVEYI